LSARQILIFVRTSSFPILAVVAMANGDKFLTEFKLHFAFTGMPVHYSC
jgi:hypothetical protein